jgi:hypothetical protein
MPGCWDVIRDRWNGFLIPPRSPELLAARIVELLQDRDTAKAMGERASQLVRQEYNLDLIVAHYAALYGELVNCSDRIGVPIEMRDHHPVRPGRPTREREVTSWRTGT